MGTAVGTARGRFSRCSFSCPALWCQRFCGVGILPVGAKGLFCIDKTCVCRCRCHRYVRAGRAIRFAAKHCAIRRAVERRHAFRSASIFRCKLYYGVVMPNVYIEARPKGRPEGTRIDDYVVEDGADCILVTRTTQHQAIAWAKKNGHRPLVARVRHLNDKMNPGHWRSA